MKKKINIAVLGASGYVGIELLQRLSKHPGANLVFLGSRNHVGHYPASLFPPLRQFDFFQKTKFADVNELCKSDVIISALPVGLLPRLLSEILPTTQKLINVSGDFRLIDSKEIAEYYPNSLVVQKKIDCMYLIPELSNDFSAKILNMPGCIAAAAIYALYPLAKNGLLENEVIIDAKVGSSGSGKQHQEAHSIRVNNAKTYKLLNHRHTPEIKQYINNYANLKQVYLTVTSIDVSRGVLIHVHGNTAKKIEERDLFKFYLNAYKNHPFIRIICSKHGYEKFPSIKTTQGTNNCEIGFTINSTGNHFVITAALDNLVKGGVGNAIQTFNKLFGFKINLGLESNILWP